VHMLYVKAIMIKYETFSQETNRAVLGFNLARWKSSANMEKNQKISKRRKSIRKDN
jgi:hypothetical protein